MAKAKAQVGFDAAVDDAPETPVAAPVTQVKVKIPQIRYHEVLITLTGTKPLLVNRLPYIAKGQKLPEMNDDEKFQASLYIMTPHEDGSPRYGFPASGIKGTAVNAGRMIPGLAMTEIRGMFFVRAEEDGLLQILDPKDKTMSHSPEPIIDRQMAKTKQGVAVAVVRARFNEWMFRVPIQYSRTFVALETILGIYNVAGSTVGLGCRRPERSGLQEWGTFEVPEE